MNEGNSTKRTIYLLYMKSIFSQSSLDYCSGPLIPNLIILLLYYYINYHLFGILKPIDFGLPKYLQCFGLTSLNSQIFSLRNEVGYWRRVDDMRWNLWAFGTQRLPLTTCSRTSCRRRTSVDLSNSSMPTSSIQSCRMLPCHPLSRLLIMSWISYQ